MIKYNCRVLCSFFRLCQNRKQDEYKCSICCFAKFLWIWCTQKCMILGSCMNHVDWLNAIASWFYKIIFLLQENFWAIGTSPGATDVQDFSSIGLNVAGINNKLGGILQHDQTYYASFVCSNGAGLNTSYIDTKGMCFCMHSEILFYLTGFYRYILIHVIPMLLNDGIFVVW